MTIEEFIVVEEDIDDDIEAANLALLRELYAAYGRKDPGPLLESLHEDVQFSIVAHPEQFPFGGTHRGRAEVERAIALIDRDYDWLEYGAHDFVIEGDRVVVLTGGIIQHRATGARMNLRLVDIVRLSDGKIVEFVEFGDTGSLLHAQGAFQPKAPAKAQPKPRPKAAKKAAKKTAKKAKAQPKPAKRAKAPKPARRAKAAKRAKAAVKAKPQAKSKAKAKKKAARRR
jgi:hypothetical protein